MTNSKVQVERRSNPRPGSLKFKTIILILGVSIFAFGLSLTAMSAWTAAKFTAAGEHSLTMLASMRAHMTGDMMHDGLRGVVFRAMYAAEKGNASMLAESKDEVAEYGGTFRDALAAQNQLDLPPTVRASLDAVKAPLDAYISKAEELVGAVYAGDRLAAESGLTDFDTTFKALEDVMSSISDAIEAASQEAKAEARESSALAAIFNGATLLATASLVLGMFFLARTFVSDPLAKMTKAMRDLANGIHEIDTSGVQRVSEIQAMQGVIGTYQNALADRSRLALEAEQSGDKMQARAAEADALNEELSRVAKAASDGDFSQRVEATQSDPSLTSLAEIFNDLVSNVDRVVSETVTVLAGLARADLTVRIRGEYRGALGQLKSDTNAVAERFSDVIGQLRDASGALKTATGEILSGANDLSERTTKQATTIQQTAAAMDKLATTVIESAEKAEEASSNAAQVSRTAEEGGQVMRDTTAAMERITQSSGKISNIIGLIDDIAFQTNLLALNASVEAARAGDAGKGFAVVAVEVRRLAQSAASASAEVKVLIDQSSSEVAGGSRLVASAASKLDAMLDGARRNSDLLAGIAEKSRDQASSIAEVTAAVRTMDEMTQHNAALVEETNAAIEQTEAQANELDKVVAVFTVETGASRQISMAGAGAQVEPVSIRELQARVKSASRSYLKSGAAAVKQDWSEF